MRRNPFANLLKRDPLKQAADDYFRALEDARRMEANGTAPVLPTHLEIGMYAGVAIREVPTWFLQSLTEQGPLEYALGEAVCGELLRREHGLETFTLEDNLRTSLDYFKQAHSEFEQLRSNKEHSHGR